MDLTPLQLKFLQALLLSRNTKAACKRAGIDYSTGRKWLTQEAFARAYQDAKEQSYRHFLAMLQYASSLAGEALIKELKNAVKSADRIRAANILGKLAVGSVLTTELLERLDALGERIEALEAKKAEKESHDAKQP